MHKPRIPGEPLEDFPTVVYTRAKRGPRTQGPAQRWTLERKLLVVNAGLALAVLVEWLVFGP